MIDWDAVLDEATAHLQALIRFDTTNPPGNETPAAEYIAGACRAAGIEAAVFESRPGRGNVVARLRAVKPTAKPLLLMGHLDVVGVERARWTRDPFGGDLADGCVWGRGALDMKSQVAAELTVLLMLKRAGVALDRDLILAAFADEEVTTGEDGAVWMWANHRDQLDAEYAINEGGGWQATLGGQRFYLCQVGEKGASRLRLTARGPAGHASVPLDETAMTRLGRALVRIAEWTPPIVVTPVVARMIETMAAALGPEAQATARAALANPTWEEFNSLPFDDDTRQELRASLANTAVPTIVRGGQTINVIPSEVTLEIDGRLLPGEEPEAFRATIQSVVGDEVTVELTSRESGIAADPDSPLAEAIAATMAGLAPEALVAPYLSTGGTDARALPGVKVVGFFPFAPSDRQPTYIPLIHGHDERIAVEDLLFGTRFLYEVVRRFTRG